MKTTAYSILRADSFFGRDFPFSIRRERHTPDCYNDATLHQRDFWKIIYISAGKGQKLINGEQYPLYPGSLFLIHPKDTTSFLIEPPQIEICNILFQPELIAEGVRELSDDFRFFSILQPNFQRDSLTHEQLYIQKSAPVIDRLIHSLEEEFRRRHANYRCLIRLHLLELLILLGRNCAARKRCADPAELAAYAGHIINQHFHTDISLDYLAEQCGVSKPHLCRVYRTATGHTIMEDIRARRLRKAAEMLRENTETISNTCYACGFNDLSYFYRSFQAFAGCNPGDYRRKYGQH